MGVSAPFSRVVQKDKMPRTHLQEYLDFYLKLNDPGYAVLVTGAWGTGKTFQVKQCVPEDQRCYVSLFGIQTVEQLHAEVLAVAFPTLEKAGKLAEHVGDTAKSAGGLFALAGTTPAIFGALFRRELKADRTLVFDDLERSSLPPKDMLGAINSYVEQKGFRVVVIAHDEKLAEEFLAMKEKTFGQVIRVAPQIEAAFESYSDRTSSKSARNFLLKHKPAVLAIFAQSGEASLRILKHILEDLGRVHGALSDRHLAHDAAMDSLVTLFSAFDIEVRSGRLSAADLKDRFGVQRAAFRAAIAKDEGVQKTSLMTANDRYAAIDLEDSLLNDDVLSAIFVDGRYEPAMIRASLDNSAFFIEPSNVPPWKVLVNFDQLENEVVEEGRRRMDAEFDGRKVTDSGEMLHVFALRLMMADHGISGRSLEEETKACQQYIEDVLADGRLPARGTDWRWWDEFDQSHDGHGYWVTEAATPHFKMLYEHLVDARQRAFEQQLPAIAKQILALVASDSKALFELISPTNNGDNPYAHIPVLHGIEPEAFVDSWFAAPKEQWRFIGYALQNRYDQARLERELKDEAAWARQIHDLMLGKASKATGFEALRIRRFATSVFRQLADT